MIGEIQGYLKVEKNENFLRGKTKSGGKLFLFFFFFFFFVKFIGKLKINPFISLIVVKFDEITD